MIIFHYGYRLNGRGETLTIGRNGEHGISVEIGRVLAIDGGVQVRNTD